MSNLFAIGLIEKDTYDSVQITWSYPIIEKTTKEVIINKCPLNEEEEDLHLFTYGHFMDTWFYIESTQLEPEVYSKFVTHVGVVLLAKDFNPEKYLAVTTALISTFISTNSVVEMLKAYLTLFTKNTITFNNNAESNTIDLTTYDNRLAYVVHPICPIINQFQIESILIYNALLLKCKVAVIASNLDTLKAFTRTLPLFVWHRRNWNIVYPHVELNELELGALAKQSTYIAGFIDTSVENRTDLYDICINVYSSTVNIAEHAKDIFKLGKTHKDISKLMTDLAQDSNKSDQLVVKEISQKTKELITNLKSLSLQDESGEMYITHESLKTRKFTPAMENFLYRLATVEGLTKL